MKNLTSFLKRFGLPFLVILAFFLFFKEAYAASETGVGITQIDSSIGIGSSSPLTIAVRVLQVALSFLGIIALGIIIYAGFLWMTSGGNENKIDDAKKLLRNGVIGLIIILSAWGITTYVLRTLLDVTGSGSNGTAAVSNTNLNNLSLGAVGSCSVESFYPTEGKTEVPRNTSILVTFKEAIKPDSVCVSKTSGAACACNSGDCSLINPENIEIYKTAEGNSCSNSVCDKPNNNLTNASVSISTDGKSIIIKPTEYMGSSNGNVEYAIRLTSGLQKLGGESIFKTCSADYFEWKFETNNKLDLEAPQVLSGGVFPPVDGQSDLTNVTANASFASAQISVVSCPKTYAAAKLVSVTPIGLSPVASLEMDKSYAGSIKDFTFDVVPNKDKLRLYSGSNLLGTADIVNNQATFPGYFTISLNSSFVAGNSWEAIIEPAQAADNLTVASITYVFVKQKSDAGNGIEVPTSCTASDMALNMQLALSGNPDIDVSRTGGTLNLKPKVAGASGNNFILSSNSQGLSLKPFAGGADKTTTYAIRDKKDKPMNSVIQINFNEAMNPSFLVGTADEVKNYIQVKNSNTNALASGAVCTVNDDCASYDCQAGRCVGNYVSGKFSLSSDYDTLEFISNKECGVNSCGEKMYCLPASSHLAVRIKAATLNQCASKDTCLPFAPYSECVAWEGGKVCRDISRNVNYPLANTLNPDGITDLAFNSLDGNRDNRADGQVNAIYPYFVEGDANLNKRDGYEFSFYISNQINSTPPTISILKPGSFANNITAKDPVIIDFNDLMMNDSLRTGSIKTDNGGTVVEHKLMNLKNLADKPLGYWVEAQNKEIGVPDGEPDATTAIIGHSDFFESITYLSQIGSGVKNIYQNCFKPSSGPDCTASDKTPSCCFGSSTSALDKDGNCVILK
jgi:hypothetical protein